MTECMVPQDICDLFIGDTFPFKFEFKQPDGSPLNIANMVIVLTMTVFKDDEFQPLEVQPHTEPGVWYGKDGAFRKAIEFPEFTLDQELDQDSINGIGYMTLYPYETAELTPGKMYWYKFKLENGPAEVFTVGVGQIRTI